MLKKIIKNLSWDSDFFEFPVAKFETNNLSIEQLAHVYSSSTAKLIYYSSPATLDDELLFNKYYNIKLVDAKVPLKKYLIKNVKFHPKVEIYEGVNTVKELVELALIAGSHSRFKIDDCIPNEKFEELYSTWIEKIVSREMSDILLVYKDDDNIVGFLSIDLKKNEPYISLLAVRPKYEGKGIAFALMNSGEHILVNKGYKLINSATQERNRKALAIYRRHGLEIGKPTFTYHFWRK